MSSMDRGEFIAMMRALLAQIEEEEEPDENPPPAQAIYTLTGFVESLRNQRDYEVGDLVMLKPTMLGYRHPSRKFPGIVMEINDWASTPKSEESSIDKRENVIVGCVIPVGKTKYSVAMYALDERFLMRHDEANLIKDAQMAELREMLGMGSDD